VAVHQSRQRQLGGGFGMVEESELTDGLSYFFEWDGDRLYVSHVAVGFERDNSPGEFVPEGEALADPRMAQAIRDFTARDFSAVKNVERELIEQGREDDTVLERRASLRLIG
jgi:hypothetical protein